jgi:hypothetical protein
MNKNYDMHDEQDSFMHAVGHRQLRPITFSASPDLLVEGARFNSAMQELSGDWTCIPKGVYRFKTHEDANQFDLHCVAKKMSLLSKKRS